MDSRSDVAELDDDTWDARTTNSKLMRTLFDNEYNRSGMPSSPSILVNIRLEKERKALMRGLSNEYEGQTKQSSPSPRGERAASTSTQETSFRLMALPLEIRLMILEFTLVSTRRLFLNSIATPSVAKVCRQLRAESLPLYISVNEIGVLFSNTDPGCKGYNIDFDSVTESWIQQIDPDRPVFRDVAYSLQRRYKTNTPTTEVYIWDFHLTCSEGRAILSHGGQCPICAVRFSNLDENYLKSVDDIKITEKYSLLMSAARKDHDQGLAEYRPLHGYRPDRNGVSLNDLRKMARLYRGPAKPCIADQLQLREICKTSKIYVSKYIGCRTPMQKAALSEQMRSYAQQMLDGWRENRPEILKHLPEDFDCSS